jgi:hypothetical protein
MKEYDDPFPKEKKKIHSEDGGRWILTDTNNANIIT